MISDLITVLKQISDSDDSEDNKNMIAENNPPPPEYKNFLSTEFSVGIINHCFGYTFAPNIMCICF